MIVVLVGFKISLLISYSKKVSLYIFSGWFYIDGISFKGAYMERGMNKL